MYMQFLSLSEIALQPAKVSENHLRGAIFAHKKFCNCFQIKKNCSKRGRIICEIKIGRAHV